MTRLRVTTKYANGNVNEFVTPHDEQVVTELGDFMPDHAVGSKLTVEVVDDSVPLTYPEDDDG